jgi:transcriptional regulator with XRE-family HTH domain
MLDLEEIGSQVRAIRRSMKLTQEKLASICDVHKNTINALERGVAADIQVKLLLRIMNAVGLDLRVTMLSESRSTLEDLTRGNSERLEVISAVNEFRQHTNVLLLKLVHVPSQKITKRFTIPLQ